MKNNIKATYKIIIHHHITHQFKKEIIVVIDKVRVHFIKGVCVPKFLFLPILKLADVIYVSLNL